ncbi:MAG: retropepsin-like aspartic protease [Pseudomonadales bacterium]|jgi:predicted aspartyl protease|nr:retropepsin-like aspartic protease [Pseudomonadales bacterium]
MSRASVLLLVATALAIGFGAGWFLRGSPPVQAPAGSGEASLPVSDFEPDPGPAAERDPRVVAFEAALAIGDHDRALELYEDVADSGREPRLTAQLRGRVLDPLRAPRQDAAAVTEAVAFLEAFTWLYPRDEAALTALARGQERLDRLREALDSWWRLAEAAGGGETRDRALRRARRLVDALADGARTRGDRTALVEIYREAIRRDPGAHHVRVMLAASLDEDGDPHAALDVLDGIPVGVLDDARVDRMRARVLEAVRLQTEYPQGLPLRSHGDHFVVTVATESGEQLDLLLDTGATVSVLRPQALGRVSDARPAGRTIRLATAGGVVTAPLYELEALWLGPVRVGDPRIAVMPLDGLEDLDGLLGMDQLAHFDYRIDPVLGRLQLAHRR